MKTESRRHQFNPTRTFMNPIRPLLFAAILAGFSPGGLSAADWLRFRGPNGSGIAPDAKPLPTRWSDTENLKWKTALPGPGSSCPIVVGNRVFVTCWSGYAVDPANPGDQENLKRHLVCVDRATGKILWDKPVKARLPEDRYGGMFAQHGYASHTPVSDGRAVYAFFGKSGVHAFDLEGRELWQAQVGDGLDDRNWGSACSPIIVGELVIVTAAAESQTMFAFDRTTGRQVWKSEAEGFNSTWGTPVVLSTAGREDIVLAVPREVWGISPASGKLRWMSEGPKTDSVTGSVVAHEDLVYCMGARGAGSMAIRGGGSKDVTKTHVAWTGRDGANIMTPVLVEGRLYWIAGSLANCRDAKTGAEVYSERLPGGAEVLAAGGNLPGGGRGGPGGGGPGGGRGGMGGADYASPVAGGGHWYQVTRRGDILVVKLGPTFELVSRNKFAADTSDFSATPAISDGQLFVRSAKNLYCIGN